LSGVDGRRLDERGEFQLKHGVRFGSNGNFYDGRLVSGIVDVPDSVRP